MLKQITRYIPDWMRIPGGMRYAASHILHTAGSMTWFSLCAQKKMREECRVCDEQGSTKSPNGQAEN